MISADEHRGLAEAEFSKILVPMKLGEIGEEMIATAVKLAQDRGASVEALHVIRVPLELPLDAELVEEEERAEASIAEAKLLGADHGVQVEGRTVRARAIGQAIVQEAADQNADLIVLGSAPALAPAVPVLLADRRLRPEEGPQRGPDRRVSAGCSRRRRRAGLTLIL